MSEEQELIRLRSHYPDLTDEQILKAQVWVEYVLYDTNTGEIVQNGDMDMLAYENFVPRSPNLEKMIVEPGKAWRLRGEFIDHHGDGKHMFKVEDGNLIAKPAHLNKIEELKSSKDKSDEELEVEKLEAEKNKPEIIYE